MKVLFADVLALSAPEGSRFFSESLLTCLNGWCHAQLTVFLETVNRRREALWYDGESTRSVLDVSIRAQASSVDI